jgi:hypothetical protein
LEGAKDMEENPSGEDAIVRKSGYLLFDLVNLRSHKVDLKFIFERLGFMPLIMR